MIQGLVLNGSGVQILLPALILLDLLDEFKYWYIELERISIRERNQGEHRHRGTNRSSVEGADGLRILPGMEPLHSPNHW